MKGSRGSLQALASSSTCLVGVDDVEPAFPLHSHDLQSIQEVIA